MQETMKLFLNKKIYYLEIDTCDLFYVLYD